MTDHDATNPALGTPDRQSDPSDVSDPTLLTAGQRLRQQGPDEIASRQALAQVKRRADEPIPRHRSWWPALIGAGLAAAAVVGVIAIRSDDTDTVAPIQMTPDVAPDPTMASTPDPSTTLVPTTTDAAATGASLVVDGGCITVTNADRSATGCPQDNEELDHLEQRTFVADLDGPVLITSGSGDPLIDLTTTIETGRFASDCRWDDLAPRIPDAGIVELVVCNDKGVMGVTTGRDAVQDWAISYFTLATPYLLDGADLGLGTPIDGLPGALAFTAPVQDTTTCSILLMADRSGWKEACGLISGLEPNTALVQVDPIDRDVHEIAVDGDGLITSARQLGAMAPSSGCALESASDLMRALPASSIVMGIGCIGAKASLTTGSVLAQLGPPDGSIWLAQRNEAGIWNVTDNGTGIDDQAFSFPIAPITAWETWPESTVPGFRSYWWEPIVAIPMQPTVDAFADELLATLATLDTEPEFPLNERLVEVRPAGLPLIIAQVDVGGDDSAAGAVLYVWLEEEFDDSGPIGWRSGEVLVGVVCARGGSAGRDLCI